MRVRAAWAVELISLLPVLFCVIAALYLFEVEAIARNESIFGGVLGKSVSQQFRGDWGRSASS